MLAQRNDMNGIKRVTLKVLELLDVGLYRLSLADADGIKCNSMETADAFYSELGDTEENRDHLFSYVLTLAENAGADLDGHICDVGCGTGRLLELIAGRFDPSGITGVEMSTQARSIARRKCPGAEIIDGDITAGPLGKSDFDTVFCLEVIEHIVEAEAALASLGSMIKPGGKLIITVPDGRHDNFGGHINFWSPASWTHFIEQSLKLDAQIEYGIHHSGSMRLLWAVISAL